MGRLGIKAKISSKRKEEYRDGHPEHYWTKRERDGWGGGKTLLGTSKLNTDFLLFMHLHPLAKLQTFVTVLSLLVPNKCLYMYLGFKLIFSNGKYHFSS